MATLPLDPFSYDRQSRELHNVPEFFQGTQTAIGWHPIVLEQGKVQEGNLLGSVQLQDGSRLDVRAPPGCSGTLERLNTAFRWGDADKSPSQVLALIKG